MLNGEGAGLHGPQHYEFIERNLEVGQRLYYIIEHEDIRGNVLRAGPISYLVDRAPSDEVTQSAGATPEAAHSEAAP
jgi:hypothetical protein